MKTNFKKIIFAGCMAVKRNLFRSLFFFEGG